MIFQRNVLSEPQGLVQVYIMTYTPPPHTHTLIYYLTDKENPSLVFSLDREIPTRGSTVPVGNEASPSFPLNDGPEGWDFRFHCTPMIDSISHISNKEEKHKCTLHLARHCGLPLATYCKVRHTRSDVRCT